MFREWMLSALLMTVAGAQTSETATSTGMVERMKILDRITPKNGWLATPPGLSTELWDIYRKQFGIDPPGNRIDYAKVGLGRLLFFDKRLSRDRTVACATCHDPQHGFADPNVKSTGIEGQTAARNTPTVLNVGLLQTLFWDGRAKTLEEQAAGPILNPTEMGMPNRASVVDRVREEPEYVALFELAYGREPEFEDVARQLAAFQRTLIFVDAPFDAFRAGQKSAISTEARKGMDLFAKHCTSCHPISLRAPLLSDDNFHNIGIGFKSNDHQELGRAAFPKLRAASRDKSVDTTKIVTKYGELGRALISALEYQVGAFRTAPLRNIALTAPYMHDGSIETLWEVVAHYNQGGTPNTWLDPQIMPLGLSDQEIDQIVAFLFCLTDQRFAAESKLAHTAQKQQFANALAAKKLK